MSTRHKLTTTLLLPDGNTEVDVVIRFNYTKGSNDYYNRAIGTWEQGYAAEIELDSCEPMEYEKEARAYLETDTGYQEAFEVATNRDDV